MLENCFSKEDVAGFRAWLEWADRIVVVAHMSPDGDAVGSALAMTHFLRDKEKKVEVILPDSIPEFLSWLPGADRIICYSDHKESADVFLSEADVICCVDFNAPCRTGNMEQALSESKAKKIMIDHHPDPVPFCDVILSRPGKSSASELVFQFLCALGEYRSISPQIAECIYTGMMTDTGAFTYNSSYPQIFYIVSRLIDKGIDKDEIYRRVYHSYSVERLRFMGFVLSKKMQVFPEWSAAVITLTRREQDSYHTQKGDTEGFANLPLQIKGIKFSVFLREEAQMLRVKASLRSVGSVPANRFAADYFNGGGHTNAAGGEFNGTLKAALARYMRGMEEWQNSQDPDIEQLFKQD